MSESEGKMGFGDGLVPSNRKRHYTNVVLPSMAACVEVLGVFMLAAGIAVIIIEKHHAAISTVSFQSASVVLLIAGIVSLIAGIFEFWVTKCGNREPDEVKKYSLIFMVLVLLAALLAFVAAIMGFVYIGKVGNKMEDDLTIQLKRYGVTGHYTSLMNMNRIQSKNQCCGVINYADWRNTSYGGHRYDKVPDSCCIQQKHACGFEFDLNTINHGGCLKMVKRSTSRHLRLVGIGGIIVALIELALGVAVQYIRKKIL